MGMNKKCREIYISTLMLTGFNETHIQIEKSVWARQKRNALLTKRCEELHF